MLLLPVCPLFSGVLQGGFWCALFVLQGVWACLGAAMCAKAAGWGSDEGTDLSLL
jgi:hypothetical protein